MQSKQSAHRNNNILNSYRMIVEDRTRNLFSLYFIYPSLSLSALLSICSLVHIIHFRQVLKLTYPTYLLIRPLRLLMCKNNNLYIWLSNPSICPSFRPSFLPPSHAHEFIVDLHSQTSSSFAAQTDADALRFILLYEQTWNTTRQQTAPSTQGASN